MMLAIGTDIVDARRIERAIARHGDAFLRRVFTPAECGYADKAGSSQRRIMRYANRFAAKEAVYKALRARGKGLGWQDVEVFHEPDGSPAIRLSAKAQIIAGLLLPDQPTLPRLHLSLSDDYPYSLAFVTVSAEVPVSSANVTA